MEPIIPDLDPLEAKEFAVLLRRMFHSRPLSKAALPQRLVDARLRLEHTRPGRKKSPAARSADYELLATMGMLLSTRAEPMTMGELSRELQVPLSTATRIVDWLVNSDFAQRLPDPADRRIVRLALSPTGWEIYQLFQAVLAEHVEKWLSPFTPEERSTLIQLMRRLLESMEAG